MKEVKKRLSEKKEGYKQEIKPEVTTKFYYSHCPLMNNGCLKDSESKPCELRIPDPNDIRKFKCVFKGIFDELNRANEV